MSTRAIRTGGPLHDDESEAAQRVAQRIDRDRADLIDLCVELGAMPSPHGQELAVATRVMTWFHDNDLESWLQPITGESANAVGRLRGSGGGSRLILDAHIDTGPPLRADAPERIRRINGAWVDDDTLYGFGVVNDKAQVAAFMLATRALAREGIRLAGDLIVAAVAFETGAPSVGRSQGIDFPGEGFGSWWLVNRGVTADFALIGETSGFGLVTAECGELGLEVRLSGKRIYTPRFERGADVTANPSAVVRVAAAASLLEAWALEYEQRSSVVTGAGRIVPRAQITTVQGAPDNAFLRIDVRLAPGANPRAVEDDVRACLRRGGLDAEVEPFQWSRGYIADGAGPLVDAVTSSHRAVIGGDPPAPPTPEISMWRDLNVFNELGIPSICYGPPRTAEPYSDPGDRAMRVDDLIAATKVYALTAMKICGLSEQAT